MIIAPLVSLRTPEEDGGREAIVNADGCTLVCKGDDDGDDAKKKKGDDDDDELVLTDLVGWFEGVTEDVLECSSGW